MTVRGLSTCLGPICTTYISCTIAYPYQSFPILPCRQVASKCHPHTYHYILWQQYQVIKRYLVLYHRSSTISLCTIHIVCCTFFCLGSLYDFHSCVSTQGLNERCTARPLRESVFCVPTSLSFFLYPFPLSFSSILSILFPLSYCLES